MKCGTEGYAREQDHLKGLLHHTQEPRRQEVLRGRAAVPVEHDIDQARGRQAERLQAVLQVRPVQGSHLTGSSQPQADRQSLLDEEDQDELVAMRPQSVAHTHLQSFVSELAQQLIVGTRLRPQWVRASRGCDSAGQELGCE